MATYTFTIRSAGANSRAGAVLVSGGGLSGTAEFNFDGVAVDERVNAVAAAASAKYIADGSTSGSVTVTAS